MADQSALNQAFAEYARSIALQYEIGEVLFRLTDQAVSVLGVDGAGVSIVDADGSLQFVTATDQHTTRVEEHQIETSEGPCHQAFLSGKHVTCTDLSADDRWPVYAAAALEEGLRAAVGIPMTVEGTGIGALNLYAREARAWTEEDLEVGQLLADMASGYIVNARILAESRRLANQLQNALDSRVVIEQAKGIAAERHGIDPSAAFDMIRSHARSNNETVHEIARAIVERSLKL
jgi:GAF domain-containing protein